MTSQKKVTSTYPSDSIAVADIAAANDSASNEATTDNSSADNGVDLATVFDAYFRPDANTIVCGALDDEKVASLAQAGVELVINLQPDDELSFDEAAAVERAGMHYEHLPINGAADLKQLKILAFDNILRQYHGKKIAMHCGSGNRVGAAIALRAGWLRGRKMDTAMERGRSHGLTKLEQEVHNRLLVPR
ncbi:MULTISPECIES: beta-lactamase hydrolase domain-containing protein [Psychrobacter]|uniref:beta-lactamase hydrolase domain-containing protein n=1 Tax=Psychrobacter TaxID=497 RepID=UPI000ED9E364|nr:MULTISPECIES: sulfur transferase domain-containing protein [Psychrobacter]HCN18307.1 serine/threonine protein phosphatase [Psychrobacter sp.]